MNRYNKYDFSLFVKRHPKFGGYEAGLEKLHQEIKTDQAYFNFAKAHQNYLKHARTIKNPMYVKNWNTFAIEWKNWVEPTGTA